MVKQYNLVKNNWGEDIQKKIGPSTYGCINILFDYERGTISFTKN